MYISTNCLKTEDFLYEAVSKIILCGNSYLLHNVTLEHEQAEDKSNTSNLTRQLLILEEFWVQSKPNSILGNSEVL